MGIGFVGFAPVFGGVAVFGHESEKVVEEVLRRF